MGMLSDLYWFWSSQWHLKVLNKDLLNKLINKGMNSRGIFLETSPMWLLHFFLNTSWLPCHPCGLLLQCLVKIYRDVEKSFICLPWRSQICHLLYLILKKTSKTLLHFALIYPFRVLSISPGTINQAFPFFWVCLENWSASRLIPCIWAMIP